MSFGQGHDFVGSAWTIGESAIFTAGHCVKDQTLGWATSMVFRARYNHGSSIGTWTIRLINSLNGWINSGDFQQDMGAAIATSPIRPTTGKSGWLAIYPANQGPYTEIGYPAQVIPGYNFDGESMWQSVGAYLGGSTIIEAEGNMTGGCSGGPWAVNNDAQKRNNGLNSHRFGDGNVIYSPYFGDNFLNLLKWIKDSGGDS
jgi:V8-like Glu-specific endopeptidase